MIRYPFPKIDLHLHLDGSLLPATRRAAVPAMAAGEANEQNR